MQNTIVAEKADGQGMTRCAPDSLQSPQPKRPRFQETAATMAHT